MDRRQFLKNTLVWSAGVGMPIPLLDISNSFAAPLSSNIVVATGKPYESLVRRAIETAGGMSGFVKTGDIVVIKPNIGWDRSPDQAANTHPLVVKTLAELALEAGASKVNIFDRTCNEKRRCYVNSGIEEAIKSLGNRRVRLEHIDNRKFIALDIKNGQSLKRWEIYQDALDADCYINVPVAKNHGLSGLTLGLKNSMGVIGGNRGSLHFDLGQKLADLATVLRPTLTVIDATRMLMRNGPQGGRVSDVKVADTLIVTEDMVAADAYAATLFGMRPEDIDSTVAAARMGLGVMDLNKMRIAKVEL
jgi:uncharacterized protein (DUF362 family)